MVTRSIIIFSVLSLLLTACSKRERKNFYFSNGQLKHSIELFDGKRDGWDYLYDSLGNLLMRQQTADDTVVSFEEYYHTGAVRRRGAFVDSHYFQNVEYFPNGNIKSIHLIKDFLTEHVERYNEDGSRDTIPFPVLTNLQIANRKKWKKEPGLVQMHCVIVNFVGDVSDMYAGKLIVGRRRDNQGFIRDTIRIVKPDDRLNYFFDYPDAPNDTIWIQVLYGSAKDTTSISVHTRAIWDESRSMDYMDY